MRRLVALSTSARERPQMLPSLLLLAVSLASAPPLPPPSGAPLPLVLALPGGRPVAVDDAAWRALPRETVTARDKEGEHSFTGVRLSGLLASLGIPVGEAVRGDALSLVVVVAGRDGYQAAISLAELEETLSGRIVLLAELRDGQPLSPDRAPLQLIVTGDRRPTRQVRMVTSVTVVRLPTTNATP